MEPQNPSASNEPQDTNQPNQPNQPVPEQPMAEPVAPPVGPEPVAAVDQPTQPPIVPPAQPDMPQQNPMQPVQPGMQPLPAAKKSKKLLIIAVAAVVVLIAGGVAAAVLLSGTPKVDEKTFEKNFTSCKKSYTVAPKDAGFTGDATATIHGKKGNGCSVTIKFGAMTGAEAVVSNKEMTCSLDNSQDLGGAFDAAFSDPSKYDCTGTLIDYIKSHQNG